MKISLVSVQGQDPVKAHKIYTTAGVILRPELDNPEWGIQNVFEDGCGNLLMIDESKPTHSKS